jgi:hypothetical protein
MAGDAARRSSPMSGQRASLALLGAYIRTQRLVDLHEGMNGGPIAPDDFYKRGPLDRAQGLLAGNVKTPCRSAPCISPQLTRDWIK